MREGEKKDVRKSVFAHKHIFKVLLISFAKRDSLMKKLLP